MIATTATAPAGRPRKHAKRRYAGNDCDQHEDVAPGVVAPEVAQRRVRESTGDRETGTSELAVTHPEALGEVPAVLDHRGVQERVDHVGLPEEPGPQRPEQEEWCREQEASR